MKHLLMTTISVLTIALTMQTTYAKGVTVEPFGVTPEGKNVDLYTLSNDNGMTVTIMEYGATVVSIIVPDKDGNPVDVALGFDDLQGYIDHSPYFGCVVGRYGNRIAEGKFELDGKTYTLAANNGPNHLHGGEKGFDKRIWQGEINEESAAPSVDFTYVSADGEEGYPGELRSLITYTLTPDNGLRIDYISHTDKPTPVNLTNHTYFNLDGEGTGSILDNTLMLKAKQFVPVDETFIPLGDLREVKGTPFDFTTPHKIGARIDSDHQQIEYGLGYDHTLVFGEPTRTIRHVGKGEGPDSGIVMHLYTTEPGVQFYTGNFLDGSFEGKNGHVYEYRNGFCLEMQHFPDSPNQPQFPSTILRPGEVYNKTTVYEFATE